MDTSKVPTKRMHKGPYRSRILPVRRPNQRALKYIISKKGKKPADLVASEMKISRSWAYNIWQYHTKTGQIPQPKKMGRPAHTLTAEMIKDVLAAHAGSQEWSAYTNSLSIATQKYLVTRYARY